MAAIGYYKDAKGRKLSRILFVNSEGDRKTVYLGDMRKSDVGAVKARVEKLVSAQLSGHVPDDDTTKWVAKLSTPLAKKLAAVGLIESRESQSDGQPALLDAFCARFIEGRSSKKPATLVCYEQARKKLVKYFGATRKLSKITSLDADEFREWLIGKEGVAETTCRAHIKNAKLIFKAAERGRLIASNPFIGHKTAVGEDRQRMAFIDRATTTKVLDACPSLRWRAIVALCRFGGLRCPSEVLSLKWDDIDWDNGKMTVRAPKTEHHADKGVRVVPLFPEVRKELLALMVSPDPAEYVIEATDRTFATNLRTVFLKILAKAKIEPWVKPFQNLRSSRETELAHDYPLHLVVAWLGNSIKVAAKHYLQVCDSDFNRASGKNNTQNNTADVGEGRKSSAKPAAVNE
ncbi:MAG TPA: tyrosine-type recombinase/integrase [Schlesneria sp.]|jgi:integrase